jgi:serine phosphatase RsbU (regulator of sigma subunit)
MMNRILILVFLISTSSVSNGQNILRISDREEPQRSLNGYLEIYCDTSNSLDINQITTEKLKLSITPLDDYKEKITPRFTYWLHLTVEKENLSQIHVGLYIPLEDHIVDVFTINDTTVIRQRTGFFINSYKNNEIIPLSNILRFAGTGRTDIWLKIKNINDEIPKFRLELRNIDKAITKNRQKITIDALVQGMIWLMILYGIFLFFLHKDKLYLYYSAYSFFLSLWLMGTWGFYYQFFYGLSRSLYIYQSIPGFLGIVFYIQFIRTFISTPKIFAKWDKLLRIVQLIALIEIIRILIFVPATNLVMTNYYIQASVSMVLEIFLMIFIINVLLTKIQFKNIIGIGSSILIICNFAGAFLWIIYNDNSWFIIQKTGAVLELIIFNFGLSYRYMLIEKKEQKFQKKLIVQLERNSDLQQKVNRELEQKVQERTVELKEKNEVLEQQKNEIEYHNNNLKTSIHYAQRIQSAVFPSDEILSVNLPEYFVFFRPVDIVSGDFYWLKQIKNIIFVAVADCTGHGVPGAFMSILGITSLNEIVNTDEKPGANKVLDQLREHVIKTLHQSTRHSGTRDGMEMALCIIDMENRKLQFAGAFRPMYIISDGILTELPGNKRPIGVYDDELNPFSEIELRYKIGDVIYMFTDGYADQIGGAGRKTFKTKRLKELLLEIHKLPMERQKEVLETNLEEWKGKIEQVDDILVIGIRLNDPAFKV